jgi:hypothetical protein
MKVEIKCSSGTVKPGVNADIYRDFYYGSIQAFIAL